MAQSSIEWTELTWNPTTGCEKFRLAATIAMQKLCLGAYMQWRRKI